MPFSCVQTTGQSRPDCEIFTDMVVNHGTEGAAGRECVEDRCKIEIRKRKASEDEIYDEKVNERETSVLNTAEEQSSEKCELSR